MAFLSKEQVKLLLNPLSMQHLKHVCRLLGVRGYSKLKKDKLVDTIISNYNHKNAQKVKDNGETLLHISRVLHAYIPESRKKYMPSSALELKLKKKPPTIEEAKAVSETLDNINKENAPAAEAAAAPAALAAPTATGAGYGGAKYRRKYRH